MGVYNKEEIAKYLKIYYVTMRHARRNKKNNKRNIFRSSK